MSSTLIVDDDADIVLDQAMPGLSGMQVAEIILGERPDQAIVMFTANADDFELCWATRRGVRAVLDKPHWSLLIDVLRGSSP
jgi:CheY-like chemotaxis protein